MFHTAAGAKTLQVKLLLASKNTQLMKIIPSGSCMVDWKEHDLGNEKT